MAIGVFLNRGDLVSTGEHANKADSDIAEEEEVEEGSHNNDGQVRLRTLDVTVTRTVAVSEAAAAAAAASAPATTALVSRGRLLILRLLEKVVVDGSVGKDRRRLQEDQRVDHDGQCGDDDARQRRMSPETGEGQDEEQAEPDETENGQDDVECEYRDFRPRTPSFLAISPRRVARYAEGSDHADGEGNEDGVKNAGQ